MDSQKLRKYVNNHIFYPGNQPDKRAIITVPKIPSLKLKLG